jgi:predicted DNA-binding transcriptional regulator YafY
MTNNTADAIRAEAHRAGQAHADAGLLAALEAVTDDLEAEIEAKRGTVLARTTERDLASVRAARAAIAAAKGVGQ